MRVAVQDPDVAEDPSLDEYYWCFHCDPEGAVDQIKQAAETAKEHHHRLLQSLDSTQMAALAEHKAQHSIHSPHLHFHAPNLRLPIRRHDHHVVDSTAAMLQSHSTPLTPVTTAELTDSPNRSATSSPKQSSLSRTGSQKHAGQRGSHRASSSISSLGAKLNPFSSRDNQPQQVRTPEGTAQETAQPEHGASLKDATAQDPSGCSSTTSAGSTSLSSTNSPQPTSTSDPLENSITGYPNTTSPSQSLLISGYTYPPDVGGTTPTNASMVGPHNTRHSQSGWGIPNWIKVPPKRIMAVPSSLHFPNILPFSQRRVSETVTSPHEIDTSFDQLFAEHELAPDKMSLLPETRVNDEYRKFFNFSDKENVVTCECWTGAADSSSPSLLTSKLETPRSPRLPLPRPSHIRHHLHFYSLHLLPVDFGCIET